MLLKLNERKASMLSIGKLYFTFASPGPHDIDIEIMDKPQLNQLLYNIRKGTLTTTESMQRLLELTEELPAASKRFATPNEQPLKMADQVLEPQGRLEEDLKELKKILSGNVQTVKKAAGDMAPARVRKLLEIELNMKKRASVIQHLEKIINDHIQLVTQQLGTQPAKHQAMTQADLTRGIDNTGRLNLNNVGEVVESEVEQIQFNPSLNPHPED